MPCNTLEHAPAMISENSWGLSTWRSVMCRPSYITKVCQCSTVVLADTRVMTTTTCWRPRRRRWRRRRATLRGLLLPPPASGAWAGCWAAAPAPACPRTPTHMQCRPATRQAPTNALNPDPEAGRTRTRTLRRRPATRQAPCEAAVSRILGFSGVGVRVGWVQRDPDNLY